jgi:hypothetical protein
MVAWEDQEDMGSGLCPVYGPNCYARKLAFQVVEDSSRNQFQLMSVSSERECLGESGEIGMAM